MEEVDVKVRVEVQEAEQNLDKIINKADEAKDHLEDINDTVDDGIPSVEGLDKAFESAFNSLAKEGSKGGTVLKKLFDSVKNAIPVVKNINTTAITGLKGIKAAIASTGIGLLVVALGEILAHWKDIANWIGIGTRRQEEYTRAVEQSEAAMDRLNFQHEKEIRLLKAAGASNTEIAEAKVRQTEEDRKQLDLLYMQNMAHTKGRKERKQLTEEYEKQAAEANKAVVAAKRELEIVKEEEKIRAQRAEEEKKEREAEERRNRRSSGSSKSTSTSADPADAIKQELEKIKTDTKDVMDTMRKIAENFGKDWPQESVEYFKKLLDPESVRDSSEKVIAELKKAGVEINEAIINSLLKGEAQEYSNELNELISARHLFFATGHKTLSQDLQTELDIQNKAYEQEVQILSKRMEYIKQYLGESDEYKDLESQLVVIADQREAFLREQTRKIAEAVLEEETEVLDKQSELLNFGVGIDVKAFQDNYTQRLEALQKYTASVRDSYDEGTAEYEKYAEEYEKITEKLNGVDKERVMAVSAYLQQQFEYWDKLVSSIGSLFDNMADIYEEDIKARQERGEISEKQAEREFERVKVLQRTSVVLNTIAGAIGAFLQASAAYPPPWGQILGATTAASVTAAGIAQIKRINNTKLGSDSVSGGAGASAPNVGVTPIEVTEDIQQSPSVLANSQSPRDQRVYILEGDIQESDRRVEIREENSTF